MNSFFNPLIHMRPVVWSWMIPISCIGNNPAIHRDFRLYFCMVGRELGRHRPHLERHRRGAKCTRSGRPRAGRAKCLPGLGRIRLDLRGAIKIFRGQSDRPDASLFQGKRCGTRSGNRTRRVGVRSAQLSARFMAVFHGALVATQCGSLA